MNIHFIGIGGIGMSALARFFLAQGRKISGSDAASSEITNALQKEGARIFTSHKASNVSAKTDQIVYSAAIVSNNPELKQAKKLGIPLQTYAQALGKLTKQYYTIAVCGSHGKSTTTALLSLVLIKAGFDPTVIVGTKLKEFGNSNFLAGQSKYLVIEADEYNRSFHNYSPQIVVVTNIDQEHLDTYGSLRGVIAGFSRFFKNVPAGGTIVANWQDKDVRAALGRIPAATKAPAGRRTNIVYFNRGLFQPHQLQIPGDHNQLNAEAAWQVVKLLGVKRVVAEWALAAYQGAWRRLERIKSRKSYWRRFIIYSDYAHHPTEIKATLQALRQKYSKRKIICVFQPHQQDRLTRLFKNFLGAFDNADKLILLPAYIVKGRDNRLPTQKTSQDLAKVLKQTNKNSLKKIKYCPSFTQAFACLKTAELPSASVLVFMGAGDLDMVVKHKLL